MCICIHTYVISLKALEYPKPWGQGPRSQKEGKLRGLMPTFGPAFLPKLFLGSQMSAEILGNWMKSSSLRG